MSLLPTTPDEFDWGTLYNEKFIPYIIRIENQIDIALATKQSIPISVIMSIFEDVVTNPQGQKMGDMYLILKQLLKREPTIEDMNKLISYVRDRLENKVERKPIITTLLS